ncbi:MAG: DEAD/DEAH box helicase, partial [Thermoanaerobaculia bacterium]
MTLRIDAEARRLTISPAALLGGTARRIGFDRGEGFERLWIGQAVHRRVAMESVELIPGYAAEKSVRFTFPVDDYTVLFEGRVDGRFEESNGRVIVDEIKSLHFAEDLVKLPGSPRMLRFQLQLGWYLHAVALSESRPVAGRLILADIETGATKIVPVAYEPETIHADLTRRVRALLQEFFGQEALAEAKAAEADALIFPFARWRPGQREMTAAVARAAAQGSHLLVEAPTGIGKTAAALYPLLRASLKQSKKLYVLTAKTTQQEIFTKTLNAIEGESFRSVRLRAKERMCANDVILCHEEHCRYAKDYGAKMEQSGLLDRLLEGERHLDPDRVFEAARQEVVCPFAVSLELAERADVVIGDYNYVFDPIVALADAKDPGALADSFLLVDEAHNLIDRGRSTYSPELTQAALAVLAQKIGVSAARSALEAERALQQVMLLVSDCVGQLPEEGGDAPGLVALDERRLDDLRLDMESLLVRHLADMRTGGDRVPDDPVLELYFTFARFHDVSRLAVCDGAPNDAFDVIAAPTAGGRLSILCKDPSQVLGPIVNGAAAMIGMSATLSPPEFHRDLIGLDRDRTDLLKLPSPFPRENRVVLVSPDIDTSWSARGPGAPKLAALVADVARA